MREDSQPVRSGSLEHKTASDMLRSTSTTPGRWTTPLCLPCTLGTCKLGSTNIVWPSSRYLRRFSLAGVSQARLPHDSFPLKGRFLTNNFFLPLVLYSCFVLRRVVEPLFPSFEQADHTIDWRVLFDLLSELVVVLLYLPPVGLF